MKVVEKFISINGEGTKAGELAVFVRFKGCNLACSYCDTLWATEEKCPYTEETPEQICEYILNSKVRNVTLTGGEPLLQEEIEALVEKLLKTEKMHIEIETNGSVPIKNLAEGKYRPSFTMDYKLPTSGFVHQMKVDNFAYLTKEDTIKFVVGSLLDLETALEVINKYKLMGRCNIYFSPVFGKIQPEEIVKFMLENNLNGVRIQLQLHKIIWDPDARGV